MTLRRVTQLSFTAEKEAPRQGCIVMVFARGINAPARLSRDAPRQGCLLLSPGVEARSADDPGVRLPPCSFLKKVDSVSVTLLLILLNVDF